MADIPDESAGPSQAHGFGSYPLSFPSEPPDIRNWFSSYQYESPEVPELDADPGGEETQDPLEFRAPPEHPSLKHARQDGSTALKGDCYGSRSERGEVSATKDLLPIGRSTVEQGTKRKRSLRELFGAGLLDDLDEDTQTESRVVPPVQRTERIAVDPMCNFNWIGLQNRKHSHNGAAEHSELLVDSDSTIIADTQENSPGGQETEHRKWPVNCAGSFNWIGLQNRKRNYEGAFEQSGLLADSDSTIIADTQENLPGCQETDRSKQPVNYGGNFNWIGLQSRKPNYEGTVEQRELLADSDCTIIAETQEKTPAGQAADHRKRQVNCRGTSLAADTEEGFLEDGIEHGNLPVNSHTKGLAETGKTEQNPMELFGAEFLNDRGKANESTSRLVSAVQRSAVDPLWKCNWVGLRNRKHSHEGAVENSVLPTDSESTCIAETQENPPGDQETDYRKQLVNCGGTSLADTEEGFIEAQGIGNSNLPIKPHTKCLADTGKTKRSLRDLFGTGFLDDLDEANESGTQQVSSVQRNAAEPLSNHNATVLPHIEQIHRGGYSELPAECDAVSSAEPLENAERIQATEHNSLRVNCGGTSLASDAEEGFLEDGIEHRKLQAKSHCTGVADVEITDIEHHRILDANCNGICSAVTEERSGREEINHDKPTPNDKKPEETVAADGFIAIRTKSRPAEEYKANRNPKPSKGRKKATLQENRGSLGTQNSSARDRTRSPLSDRTNISEAVAAPAAGISGKWKCPAKGKPYVAPPMKQLRLEQWVRRVD